MIETIFIAGPLLAAGIAAWAGADWAVLATVAVTVAGVLPFAASRASREWRPATDGHRHRAGPLRTPALWVLVAGGSGLGFSDGALVIALTAFGAAHGSPEAVGPLISIQAVVSLIAGAWYGARRWRSPPATATSPC